LAECVIEEEGLNLIPGFGPSRDDVEMPAIDDVKDFDFVPSTGGRAVLREFTRQRRGVLQGRLALGPATAMHDHRDGK